MYNHVYNHVYNVCTRVCTLFFQDLTCGILKDIKKNIALMLLESYMFSGQYVLDFLDFLALGCIYTAVANCICLQNGLIQYSTVQYSTVHVHMLVQALAQDITWCTFDSVWVC